MLVRGNEGVAGRIKISEGAIGYVEYGFAQRLGLPMAALQNRAGQFIAPASGRLWAYANDAAFAYWNNKGSVALTINATRSTNP
jgi:ABC-type phosphate transport system substrate-binding protein